jgi:AcrR family transcriptional regulator
MKGTSGSRWSDTLDEHRSAQRDHVLAAALELLRERGMPGLTMSALAVRAGMSRPTLYHYFPDVDAVLVAWVGREIDRSVAALVERARATTDPLERLELLVADQVATFASQGHRLSAEHFESEAGSPVLRRTVEEGMAPLRELMTTTIAEGVRTGRLDLDIDPGAAADLLLGLLGATRRLLVAGRMGAEDASSVVMGLLRHGWVAPPASPSGESSGER